MQGEQQMVERLPPGFRFFPTDEELITCYLARKAMDASFISVAIRDVDLYKSEPWDLGSFAAGGGRYQLECCYFFCTRGSKYPSGVRARRATPHGYWKSTGKDKDVYNRAGSLVGTKKTLVFYGGRAPRGGKTGWVMHEYALRERSSSALLRGAQSEWVICRVFMKKHPVSDRKLATEETVHDQHLSPGHLLPMASDGCDGEQEAAPPVLTDSRYMDSHSGDHAIAGDEKNHHHHLVHEELLMMNNSSSSCASPSWLIHDGQLGAHCALQIMQRQCEDADYCLPELLEYDGYGDLPKRSADSQDSGEVDRHADISSASVGSLHLDGLYWNIGF
ncbi:NAC domain-containing protein 92-like [Phragmites australis]|uniref:NAC domain-containing protein 92-like n=1 Tax=Phragmites australis TaxID=29695 RepID=UPI002D77D90D|nr:NAC domain-containing protein 92-like [Phragmites australis]XP_062192363.1 NAC domain-containing protein 92-like [Phragmites australis]